MRLLTHKSAVAFAPGYETEGIDTPSAVTVNVEGRIHEAVCDGLTSRGHIVELKEDWTMFFGGT